MLVILGCVVFMCFRNNAFCMELHSLLLDMHSKHLLGSSMITLIDHNFPVRNKMFWHVVQFGNEIIVVEFFVWVDYKSFRFAYLQI